ncbi:MAG: neutral/alkaline non-lysosomal ceramidase N-terminal domain-containing protein [Promethearchaeota archaeon]
MKVGYAEGIITPPVGTPMGGYSGRSGPSEGVHDDLYCHAVSFSNGESTVVVVSCDLVGLAKVRVDALKERIRDRLSIPPGNVLISAIHTHSGPRNIEIFGPPYEGHEKIDEVIFETVERALDDRRDAVLEVCSGEVHDVGFNRRDWDEQSEVVDYEAVVLKVMNPDGTPRGVVYNFGCHPVVLPAENLQISADWPHVTKESLKAEMGPDFFVVYLQGALGNVNPVNVPFNGNKTPNGFPEVREIGEKVAAGVSRIMGTSGTGLGSTLAGVLSEVTLEPDDEEKLEEFTWATVTDSGGKKVVLTNLQVLNIGGLVVAGVPGELFAELGLKIKEKSPGKSTMVVGFANDYVGYIPTRGAYRAGGYEAIMMGLSEEEGDAVVAGVKTLIREVT